MIRKLNWKVCVLLCVLCVCFLLAACKYSVPEEKRADVISQIAETVHDNYNAEDVETPCYFSMMEIKSMTDSGSDLYKAIDKYADVQSYKVYLIDDDMVLITTDVLFQQLEGYVVSSRDLKGNLVIDGLGCDSDMVTILSKVKDGIYTFRAGQ